MTPAPPGSCRAAIGGFVSGRSITATCMPIPKSKDTVYLLNVGFFKSTDGGKTLQTIRPPHGDLSRPLDQSEQSIASRQRQRRRRHGERQRRADVDRRGLSDRAAVPAVDDEGLAVPRVRRSAGQHDRVRAGLEHTRHARRSHVLRRAAARAATSRRTRLHTNLFYSGSQGALITRFDRSIGHLRDIQPYPRFFSGEPANSLPERWQWTFPIVFSPHDPKTLYISSQHVWRTTNDGQAWDTHQPGSDTSRSEDAGSFRRAYHRRHERP